MNTQAANIKGKCILVGVTGGIAACKAAALVSKLRQLEAEVRVVMTLSACRFVTPLTFETLSARPVITSLFDDRPSPSPEHIAIADAVDLAVVAPATANILAKMAGGIADDALSTTLLSIDVPVIVCPAMNDRMWRHPAVRANAATLAGRGVTFVGPDKGWLACGREGEGRMSDIDTIIEAIGQTAADLDARER